MSSGPIPGVKRSAGRSNAALAAGLGVFGLACLAFPFYLTLRWVSRADSRFYFSHSLSVLRSVQLKTACQVVLILPCAPQLDDLMDVFLLMAGLQAISG